ncbi:glucosyltransferase domain-containing protein [Lysinibacillus sp. fls2-241-R2A-57]|uniref:glucosyltransferase domain-containing protein n=1 Tax=Lysinibacillus sp. fls2-241-R2A-57 TaxID=3040292 RepID=UPI0025537B47|nr:glucosyltransferase domain-containing protein [Lysinibacillus sp. fls2-241-R2A-57]
MKTFFQNKNRIRFTLKYAFIITLLIHLFLIVNGLQNVDSMWGTYYSKFDSSEVGRFTLSFLSSFSSYFDLQYFNSLLSIVYISITVMLLIELFDIKDKKLILLFTILYAAFPSISGTLTYSFLTDAYFLSTLLAVFSLYLIRMKNNWFVVVIVSLLIYISLGTYQSNLAYIITLLIILFIRDTVLQNKSIKFYIQGAIVTVSGLILYVLHFKFFERTNQLTSYQGVNEAGISLTTIFNAFRKSLETFNMYFFSSFKFVNIFEILNLIFIIMFFIGLIIIIFNKKQSIFELIKIVVSLLILPFSIFIIYFISPNVWYHNLMIQQMVFIYALGIIIFDLLIIENKTHLNSIFNKANFILLFIIGFNLIIITNIYYEKLETINNQTFSMLTQVSFDIRHIDGYKDDIPLVIIGDPSLTLPSNSLYDEKTPPMSPGTSAYLVNSTQKFANYLNHFIGMKNPPSIDEETILSSYSNEINNMPVWPNKESIKSINDVIIIKFPQ